ncbi:hypothetical protein HK097_007032 [Rhizophlyctis rosea]|uniref:CREG-like beta-barrel domain-containing protein n=1 Tax=Rhizophlyctis rosea TaxID=64517 RepID=A0AAD5X859_9FUNG|nr:hypothetical protein HK097_007032 [Rhizophlyctis rosea]
MHCNIILVTLVALLVSSTHSLPQYHTGEHSPREAAPLARALVKTAGIAELSTLADESVVAGLGGFPFSTPEYITDSCPPSGEPLVYLVVWGTHARNLNILPHASLSIRSTNFTNPPPTSRSPLDEARVTLIGTLSRITNDTQIHNAKKCFEQKHKEGFGIFPHRGAFWRMSVKKVRWIGGFGDRHFNGWISRDLYLGEGNGAGSAASKDAVDSVRKQWR